MRRQRAVLEPAWGKQPAATVALEDERIGTRVEVQPAALLLRRSIGRLFCGEVRHVHSCPGTRAGVPPDVLLSLRPGLAGRVGGGPVVEDAPVTRPGESPLGIDIVVWSAISATCQVAPGRWKHPGVDPDAAGGRAVILQMLVIGKLLMTSDRVAVDLHQHLLGGRLVTE